METDNQASAAPPAPAAKQPKTHKAAATSASLFVLRQLVLFGLPYAIQAVLAGVGTHHGYWWGFAGAVLSAADKYIHDSPLPVNGLLPF